MTSPAGPPSAGPPPAGPPPAGPPPAGPQPAGPPPAGPQPDGPAVVTAEVSEALAAGRPVVALETTIIAHGLPRPRNLEVALALEGRLREAGVAPATIGVLDGRVHVGLERPQLERIATDDAVVKASTRDLPQVLATGGSAATTVAATAHLAHRAGIEVFATGGLGGVHRDAERTFDESADLQVLSRTPIVVVAAGVKSILDIPATLERMETLGIGVLGYRTERFPGFYITDSGEPVDARVDSPEQVAAVLAASRELALDAAVLVANPVDPAAELDRDLHDRVLAEGLAEAEARGLRGKHVTPFLLDHMQQATGGASLEANIAVVSGNVEVAGQIALAVAGSSSGSGG